MPLNIWPRQPQTLAVVRQFIVAGSASLSFAAAGMASAWPSPTLPKIVSHDAPVSLNLIEMSRMVSLYYVGNLVSCLPMSYLADNFGRKKILLYSSLFTILSWLIILIATSAVHLYIARFLAGIQLGAIATVHSIYIGEISLPEVRGSLSVLNHFMVSAGALIMFVVGPFVYYYDLALISLVFPLLFSLTFAAMPESPYYYMMKEQPELARKSLFWLRGGINNIELDMELKQIESFVNSELKNKSSFKEIFVSEAPRKAIIISIVFTTMKILSGFVAINVFASMTLPHRSFGVLDPNECVIILGAVNLVSSLLMVCITDMFARKLLLYISCTGCGLTMLVVSIWYFLDEKTSVNTRSTNYLPFTMFLVHVVLYNIGCGNYPGCIKSELFPSHVKTKSCALTNVIFGIVSFVVIRFYLVVADREGLYINFIVFAISCFLTVIFTVYYVPETKGKTLQEIPVA
ncbi:facilitated trehalose transporter Tret1-like [Macrosteles quadrilineatus]|uniref:facilitated trehalose transporter Tret1-like n=1 Tax=Macrosteles quadrilineatus TaxID=74068 RepID=UPI0023E1E047|nr:facilitated trehalose transporter Tret1-like [Macrosteles quadrilineatus]